jgi:hypothetical protein
LLSPSNSTDTNDFAKTRLMLNASLRFSPILVIIPNNSVVALVVLVVALQTTLLLCAGGGGGGFSKTE